MNLKEVELQAGLFSNDPGKKLERLKEMARVFLEKTVPAVGDIVYADQNFITSKYPEEGKPGLVVRVLENPLVCKQFGTIHFGREYQVEILTEAMDGTYITDIVPYQWLLNEEQESERKKTQLG